MLRVTMTSTALLLLQTLLFATRYRTNAWQFVQVPNAEVPSTEFGDDPKGIFAPPDSNVSLIQMDAKELSTQHPSVRQSKLFKILLIESDTMIIGARNQVFNVSINNSNSELSPEMTLHWPPSGEPMYRRRVANCPLEWIKETPVDFNYIRMFVRHFQGRFLICGTSNCNSKCRYFRITKDGYERVEGLGPGQNKAGLGFNSWYHNEKQSGGLAVPSQPFPESAYYASPNGNIFSATYDYSTGSATSTIRQHITKIFPSGSHLMPVSFNIDTKREFVKILHYQKHIYFFFRQFSPKPESKMDDNDEDEAKNEVNEKIEQLMVGRMCEDDPGSKDSAHLVTEFVNNGPPVIQSYLQSKLTCNMPDGYRFTNMRDVSQIGGSVPKIYGIFTNFKGATASAICVYGMETVDAAFSGEFVHGDLDQTWAFENTYTMDHVRKDVIEPRRKCGAAIQNTTFVSKASPKYIREVLQHNFLLKNSINSIFNGPILVESIRTHKFTAVTADFDVTSPRVRIGRKWVASQKSTTSVDVLFIGTDEGRLLKVLSIIGPRAPSNQGQSHRPSRTTVIIEEIQIFSSNTSITDIRIHSSPGSDQTNTFSPTLRKLIVVSSDKIRIVPLESCHRYHSCQSCVALQDPYCAWDTEIDKCVPSQDSQGRSSSRRLIQDILRGSDSLCPKPILTTTPSPPPPPQPELGQSQQAFQSRGGQSDGAQNVKTGLATMHMAVILIISIVVSLTIGFLVGYKLRRKVTCPRGSSSHNTSNMSSAVPHQSTSNKSNKNQMNGGKSYNSLPREESMIVNVLNNGSTKAGLGVQPQNDNKASLLYQSNQINTSAKKCYV